MRWIVNYTLFLLIKGLSKAFYRCECRHLNKIHWNDIKLMIFLGHTSLYEPLFVQAAHNQFLKNLAKHMIAPGADKTLKRPIVGRVWRLLFPSMVPISRKRDSTWRHFMEQIHHDSVVVIAPEGRMMRKEGKDLNGRPMSIRSGVAEIMQGLKDGKILICYSGGLHHVQYPGQTIPKIFKTIKLNLECLDLREYTRLNAGEKFRKNVVQDLQDRLAKNRPV